MIEISKKGTERMEKMSKNEEPEEILMKKGVCN